MKLYKKLEQLNKNNANHFQIKSYLLKCLESYIKYNSSGYLKKGINLAKKFLKGQVTITSKELRKYSWCLEGEMFAVEFYKYEYTYYKVHPLKNMKHDLFRIRLREHLTHKQAKAYLQLLLYFVVYVFDHIIYGSTKFFRYEEYEQFLCPLIFKHYFKNYTIQ